MNVTLRCVRTIELNDPTQRTFLKIKTSSCDVGRKENSTFFLLKVFIYRKTFHLFHLSVQCHQRCTRSDSTKALVHVLDLLARGQKYQNLVLEMCLDEGKQDVELFLDRCDDIHLFQISRCRKLRLIVNGNILRIVQRESSQILYLSRLRRGEEKRLSLRWRWHESENRVQRFLESHIQNTIRFVQHEHHELIRGKSVRLFQMLQDTSGCSN